MRQTIRFCRAPDGVKLAYATSGRGPPLVKAANWLSHLEFDWQSPVWRPWLTELSKDHTLVRFDERGCGLSDWDINDFSLDAWVTDLETVVDALALTHFPLFGMSQGGAVAITYALRHPERVSHLVLCGAFARGRLKQGLSGAKLDEVHMHLNLIRLGWGQETHAFRQVFTTFFIPEGSPEQVRWFNDLQRISTSPENAEKIIRSAYMIDVSDLAPQVTVPTLILHATGDARVSFERGRELAALIPHARLVPLDSKNHVLLETEPAWERFLQEVRDFLGVGQSAELFPDLTERERDVLDLIAQGLSNDAIAAKLFRSPATVRNHITNIFDKLAVENRAQAIVKAREAGLGQRKETGVRANRT